MSELQQVTIDPMHLWFISAAVADGDTRRAWLDTRDGCCVQELREALIIPEDKAALLDDEPERFVDISDAPRLLCDMNVFRTAMADYLRERGIDPTWTAPCAERTVCGA